jgi:hypothetical protein
MDLADDNGQYRQAFIYKRAHVSVSRMGKTGNEKNQQSMRWQWK